MFLLITENELTKFLDSHKGEKGRAWLSKCQTLLCKFLTTKGDQVKGNGKSVGN